MTTQSAEMLNEDDKKRVATAKWIDLFIESDVNYSASEWIKLFLLQPSPEFADVQAILAEDDNAILQTLEEEDINHAVQKLLTKQWLIGKSPS